MAVLECIGTVTWEMNVISQNLTNSHLLDVLKVRKILLKFLVHVTFEEFDLDIIEGHFIFK